MGIFSDTQKQGGSVMLFDTLPRCPIVGDTVIRKAVADWPKYATRLTVLHIDGNRMVVDADGGPRWVKASDYVVCI